MAEEVKAVEKKVQTPEEKKAADEAKAKAELEKWNAAQAMGKYAGGKMLLGTELGYDYLAEQYVGIGPLAVPCTRGEQLAQSGDYIVVVYRGLNEDGTEKVPAEWILVIPHEPTSTDQAPKKGLTNAEYASFLKKREDAREKHKPLLEGKIPPASGPMSGTSPAQTQGPKKLA